MIYYKNKDSLPEPEGLDLLLAFLDKAATKANGGRELNVEAALINRNYIRTLEVNPNAHSPKCIAAFNNSVLGIVRASSPENPYDKTNQNILISMNAPDFDGQGKFVGMHGNDALKKTLESKEFQEFQHTENAGDVFDGINVQLA